jgi:NADPH:quinone reductase-like Zn-dependent oxidoreductase
MLKNKAMKKIILITVVVMTSCKEKAAEMPKDKTADEIINLAAVPYIARELGDLDNNIMMARDTTGNTTYREIAIDNIRRDGAEYLNSITIENIFSPDFEDRLEKQKKLIIANWRQIERNKQYPQFVIEQFKK